MKKLILTFAAMMLFAGGSFAQNYIIINSEKIFKAIPAYNQAITTVDSLSKSYQKAIDDAYATIETLYNNYQAQKAYLSESARTARENDIINREKKITEYREAKFGENGELIKKRVELIKPIQDKVFSAIESYANKHNYQMVIDSSTSTAVVFYKKELDKSDEIIAIMNK